MKLIEHLVHAIVHIITSVHRIWNLLVDVPTYFPNVPVLVSKPVCDSVDNVS